MLSLPSALTRVKLANASLRDLPCEGMSWRTRWGLFAGDARGLSYPRIWQDLQAEHGFAGGYDSIKRFARRLQATRPLPFRRMECAPGEEAQVDLGTGAPVIAPDGRRRRPCLPHRPEPLAEGIQRGGPRAAH
jgi:hypothetical protein